MAIPLEDCNLRYIGINAKQIEELRERMHIMGENIHFSDDLRGATFSVRECERSVEIYPTGGYSLFYNISLGGRGKKSHSTLEIEDQENYVNIDLIGNPKIPFIRFKLFYI